MNWHGYEQHPDAHETRPWWRKRPPVGDVMERPDDLARWVRTDGATVLQRG